MDERYNEIKLALHISKAEKIEDIMAFDCFIKVVDAYCRVVGSTARNTMITMVENSIDGKLVAASDKEVCATIADKSKSEASSALGISRQYLYRRFGEYLDRDDINKDYLKGRTPLFDDEAMQEDISVINKFIDNFKFPLGDSSKELCKHKRSVEIEFVIIYNKILSITGSDYITIAFLIKLCEVFHINKDDIMKLCRNKMYMTREMPRIGNVRKYFLQEVYTLYTEKGVSNSKLAKEVLGYDHNVYNMSRCEDYKLNLMDGKEEFYCPAINWGEIDIEQPKKLIRILHRFISYDF